MNDSQSIFCRSLNVTFTICDANGAIVDTVTVFKGRIIKAKQFYLDFMAADNLVTNHITGPAKSKLKIRDAIIVELLLGYAALKSLGQETNDDDLVEYANYVPSDLENMKGVEVLNCGTKLIAKLGLYDPLILKDNGYEAADLIDLKAKTAEFTTLLDHPEAEIKIHSENTELRDKIYKDFVAYVKGPLDTSANVYRKKNPAFYSLYRKCRKLHLLGHHKRQPGDNANPGEFDIKIPPSTIVAIPFNILADKVYLISSLCNVDLIYFTQATPDIPASAPTDGWKIIAGDEATRSSMELGYPAKVYLFVANQSNSEEGEIAIDEVI